MTKAPEMPSTDLLELLDNLERASITAWLDGGWGVDALLERQTRPHRDVDIIVCVADVPKVQEILGSRGFVVKEGKPPDSFTLADGMGLEVDVHAVFFDADGNGVYRMQNGEDWVYPAEGFSGQGSIDGHKVLCLTPTAQVLCHATGYTQVEKDYRDMQLLQERFGVELPPQLRVPDYTDSVQKRSTKMNKLKSPTGGYLIAGMLGAVAGGIAVATITRAIPKMMSRMMANMMKQMSAEGCNREEM